MKPTSNNGFFVNGEHSYKGGEATQNRFQMIVKHKLLPFFIKWLFLIVMVFLAIIFELFMFALNDTYEIQPISLILASIIGFYLSNSYGKKWSQKYISKSDELSTKLHSDEYIRGSKIIDVDEFNTEQKRAADAAVIPMRDKDMTFDIIDQEDNKRKVMKLPLGVSFQMVGFFGANGVGKSNAMMQYFTNVDGYKRVVVDIDGSFYKKFYKEGDLVFCPFTKDSVKWNIFSDIKTQFDPANIAKSLVPEDPNAGQNRFFDDGARVVVEAILTFLAKQKDSTNKNLWEYITDFELIKEIKELDPDVRRTLSFFTNEKQKLTADLLSTIISKTAVRSIEHLKRVDTKIKTKNKIVELSDSMSNKENENDQLNQSFSFREWLKDKNQQNTIYLLVDQDIQEMVLPLYRVVVEIIATEILSSSQKEKHPVFMFLDEFPSMGKMEKIEALLVRARKKFGAIIHGGQDFSQYVDIYGENKAKTMIGNTNTIFVFRHNDGEYFSNKRFDKQEVWEYSESIPMRTTDFNEGVTGNKQKKEKILVLPSEIARLENHEAYVKSLAPDITKVKFVYTVSEDKNEFNLDNNILLR